MPEEESREIRNLRMMAWERAKGELQSMLCTYWNNGNFNQANTLINEFIKNIEDEELQC